VWKTISSAPFDRDLELAVLDKDGSHALVFACRRDGGGWIKAATREPVNVRPTHWQEWCGRENPATDRYVTPFVAGRSETPMSNSNAVP
jgi:hypothetical protein